MTLAEAVAKFEARFEEISDEIGFRESGRSQHRDWSRARTGEKYLTVVPGGVKPEGAPFPQSFWDEENAILSWLIAASDLAPGKILYWRERPVSERLRTGRFVIYSRFAIAGGPDVLTPPASNA